jgi:hypothetical protein
MSVKQPPRPDAEHHEDCSKRRADGACCNESNADAVFMMRELPSNFFSGGEFGACHFDNSSKRARQRWRAKDSRLPVRHYRAQSRVIHAIN